MPSDVDNALYSPYGAYELKAKYQKNFLFGTVVTIGFVLGIIVVSWIYSAIIGDGDLPPAPTVIRTVADLGPPPTIVKRPPDVQVTPQVNKPKVGIPTPVADDEVLEEDVVLATKDDLADISAPDMGADGDVVVDIADDDYIPGVDEFVPVEIQAEMIHEVKPEYPRLARQAAIEGDVWIAVLVGKDGSVLDSKVYKSSGTASLDDAAMAVSKQHKFKPAIQNKNPVPVWVKFKVKFTLGE
ncbi:MAG: TonB family protein [candidate division Zixibacteria bacterium]|nr:TonB family protein [candidate division Zixibacteria bacterium]